MTIKLTDTVASSKSNGSQRRSLSPVFQGVVGVLVVALAAVVVVTVCNKKNLLFFSGNDGLVGGEVDDESSPSSPTEWLMSEETGMVNEEEYIQGLVEKLQPKELMFVEDSNVTTQVHQFLHLHHMKTGGTSMDTYLRCAKQRLEQDSGLKIPYYNIHECSKKHYESCKSGAQANCQNQVREASFMSYCAPLKDLEAFGWTEPPAGAVTVLRHPVDRVWSMFRFQTKGCYSCTPLLEIFQRIDNGTVSDVVKEQQCIDQLMNHETANLLSTEWDDTAAPADLVKQAVGNMRSFFTIIGLTEHLNATIQMAGHVFPWMQNDVEWSDRRCDLEHANASPQNNRCGPDNTHWDLPSHPDEETRKAIEAHNQMDMQLYEAAVQHFELQRRALLSDEDPLL